MTNSSSDSYSRPGIAGSGTIASGLAASISTVSDVRLLARSDASAERARQRILRLCERIEGSNPERVTATTDPRDLADCDLVVESVVEDLPVKIEVLRRVAAIAPDADLASTTSSLSINELASLSGEQERLFGLHVFNPVPRMELVELCLPAALVPAVGHRATAWCSTLGKTAVPVPDRAGFVVNRLLFPYLFDAVRLMEETGLGAAEVDACMQLGAGHPMGPLRLLDFVGLDVALAIGQNLFEVSGEDAHRPPEILARLIADGHTGKKAGAGFYTDYRN